MGQPIPPGDNVPLVEGLDASWNEFVSYIPEDKRAEFAPKFKERISSYEPLRQWEDFHKAGITPESATTALNLMSTIENDPKQVYETIGKYLNITPAQAQEVVEQVQEADQEDPRIAKLQQQFETLSQIMLAERQQSSQAQLVSQQEAAVDKEISDAMNKYGQVPEDEILMRMIHKGMTAEQAHQEYTGRVSEIRKTRPAPTILGAGGQIPTSRAIDPTKLDSKGTKQLVAQMLDHANAEVNK